MHQGLYIISCKPIGTPYHSRKTYSTNMMRRRRHEADTSATSPLQHTDHRGRKVYWKKLLFTITLSPLVVYVFLFRIDHFHVGTTNSSWSKQQPPAWPDPASTEYSRYGPRIANATKNEMILQFEKALLNDLGSTPYVPMIYANGKLLCRKKHRNQYSRWRTSYFIQMVRSGLAALSSSSAPKNSASSNATRSSVDYSNDAANNDDDTSLPLLAIDHDEIGCNIPHHRDDINFPRLTWATLSISKHGKYCTNAISMPSYEIWKFYHRTHVTSADWERDFQYNEGKYPWNSKLYKAVWRGATTYEGHQYHNSTLGDTPRGQLVKASMTHPELIDAAFHKIIQKFKSRKVELSNEFRVSGRIPPNDMMRYRAIIDIDGNSWSSRFGLLLCSNSVIIKIDPDFVEHFYDIGGTLKPMVHYLPASLDNITNVVKYAMDERNDNEMRRMVQAANIWCKGAMSEEGLAKDSLRRLDKYKQVLDSYNGGSWIDEWKRVRRRYMQTIDDLVDCDAWSVTDWFTWPMFIGL